MTGCIYALVDPRDHTIFYVGQTRDLDARKRRHFSGGHALSGARIRIIRSNGMVPLVVVLESGLPLHRLGSAEGFWIDLLRQRGSGLLNVQQPDRPDGSPEGMAAPGPETVRRASSVKEREEIRPALLQLREMRRQQRVRTLNLPLNAGKPWTAGEDAALQALARHGLRADDIARRFGRSRDAVAARLMRLGLVLDDQR
ncbi:MAG: GIY-YIG nuclease family protein [Ferrovibrio sp.]